MTYSSISALDDDLTIAKMARSLRYLGEDELRKRSLRAGRYIAAGIDDADSHLLDDHAYHIERIRRDRVDKIACATAFPAIAATIFFLMIICAPDHAMAAESAPAQSSPSWLGIMIGILIFIMIGFFMWSSFAPSSWRSKE